MGSRAENAHCVGDSSVRLKGRSGCRGLRDCPPVPAHTDLDGTGVLPAAGPGGHPQARLYRAGAPAAAATSSGCRRLGQTIIWAPAPPPHNMSAEAAGEPRRTGPSTAGAAAAAGAGAAAEAGAALTVVSLQAGKEACRKLIPARFAPPEVSPPGPTLPPPRISGCAPRPAPTRRAGGGNRGAPGAPGAQPAASVRRFCGQALGELAGPVQGCVGRRATEGHVAEEPWS